MLHLIQLLKDLGLNDKAASTYLVLLNIGLNPASTIAKKAKQNRSNCYAILETLVNKGFSEKIIKNNVTYFQAVEPKFILNQYKAKRYDLDEQIENLESSINELEKLKNPNQTKPKVIFYQGETGIQNMLEETLSCNDKMMRVYTCLDELTPIIPQYLASYFKRRTTKGLFVKAIFPASKTSYLRKKRDSLEMRESRLIPKEFNFNIDISIYDNKVAITSFKEDFGVLIESKSIADAQKKIFDLIWIGTELFDKSITKILQAQIEKTKKSSKL